MANRIRRGVGALWVSVPLLLLALGPPAAAARKPITGKLSKPGYTVLALAKNGKANLVQPKGLSFRLRPPAEVVTLHLRAHDGTYGGPIVVARKKHGKRAILGLRAGAKLGEVEVRAGKGYANVMRKPPERFVDATRRARARKGRPIGAGNFGHVLSRRTRGGAPGDLDLDGIPNPLDVDDDGDLVLDNLDISSVGGGARAAQTQGGCGFYCPLVSSGLSPSRFEDTRNVNAGSTLGQINEILKGNGILRFSPISDTAELDCGGEEILPDGWDGGRPYCTRGGTGTTFGTGSFLSFPGPKFGDFDLDGDGFGTFQQPSFLAPHADTTEIKTGDPLTMWDDSTGTKVSTALNFVFVTTPALVSYSDTAGNCAKVSGTPGSCTTEFSYPVPPGDPGTMGNGFPLSAPASDDVVLTLTFWRPQRQPLANDPPGAQWMDIGHLKYAVGGCSQGTLFTTDDNLKPPVLPILGAGSLEDQKDDELSSPGNTLTYTLKLSQCLAEQGSSSSFDEPGEELNLNFSAVSGATDSAQQSIWFKRQ